MSKCLYCGENPINHQVNWFYGSVDIMLSPLRRRIFYGWLGKNIINRLADWLGLTVFRILKFFGLIRLNRDVEQIKYQRAKVLWDEALKRGIDIVEIKPFGLAIDCYCAPINGKPTLFFGLPRPHNADESILDWIDDKLILKQKLSQAGLPIPQGESFTRWRQALKFFETLPKPVVVKPRKGSRGRHTTTFVYTPQQLKQAFRIAKQLCHYVLVEEHIIGDVQRGTVINGNLVGILGGSSPKVTGDGKHTIAELIIQHNRNLADKMKPIKVSQAVAKFLLRQNLTLSSVLSKGQEVALSEKIGVAYGGTSYDCTDQTHPDLKQMVIKAAEAVGDPILGFDFIVPDITKSYKQQKCGIIECNGAPFLNLHYDPLFGKTRNAAKYVWDLVQ